jgi:multidrug efflux pump subunit AcrB
MWIVRLALRRPFTFVVMAILIAMLGGAAILATPTDIFPYIDIPVVWSFTGLSPDEMEKRIVTVSERAMTTTVNDIEHIESQAYNVSGSPSFPSTECQSRACVVSSDGHRPQLYG